MRLCWRAILVFLRLLLVLILASNALAQGGTGIRVRLEDASGMPVGGAEVRFRYESGADGGSCTTGADGGCEIVVESSGSSLGFIRGYLEVMGAGKRSLIWPGGWVEVLLQLQADGTIRIDTETIGGEPTAPAPGASGAVSPGGGEAGAGPPMPTVSATELPLPGPMPGPGVTDTPTLPTPLPVTSTTEAGETGSTVARPSPVSPAIPLVITGLGIILFAWGVWRWRGNR